MALLSVRQLAVGHLGAPLLRGLDLELAAGERVAFAGPSGTGKTSALRTLSLLDAPLEGHLSLEGQSPESIGVPRWRRRVQLVAQRAIFFSGAVQEELARPFDYRTAERAFPEEEARALLERLGLASKWGAPVDTLSEGERQRVGLARALLIEPRVLLLDEPTSALDGAAAARVEAILEERCARGLAIVLVSHDDEQRERLRAAPLDLAALRVSDGGPSDG